MTTPARSALSPAAALALVLAPGAAAQPLPLGDLRPGPIGSTGKLLEENAVFVAVGGRAFFSADDGSTGREPWTSDGTPAGTMQIVDLRPGSNGSNSAFMVSVGGSAYFEGIFGLQGSGVYATDGTAAGTRLLFATSLSDPMVGWQGDLFFSDRSNLYRSDGTTAGTVAIGGKAEDAVGSDLGLVYQGFSPQTGRELWLSDGSAAGTGIVLDIQPGVPSSDPGAFTPDGDRVFFVADDGSNGDELWVTDGTAPGTTLVKDIRPGFLAGNVSQLCVLDGVLLFAADDGRNGQELWRSDGTAAGTVMVKDIRAGSSGSAPRHLVALDDVVVFAASDGTAGTELWVTDGTAPGTARLADLWPGGAGSDPDDLFRAGSRHVYFSADDGTAGRELWRTDGTAAGTVRLSDIDPGAADSNPTHFGLVGGLLYFTAMTQATGQEPYVLDPGATAQPFGHACGAGSRRPTLRADDPVLGSRMEVRGDDAFVGAQGHLLLGLPLARPVPLPGGCAVWLAPGSLAVVASFPVTAPSWSLGVPLPNDPALIGLAAALQAAFGVTNHAPGYDLSNPVRLTLGR